MVLEVVACVVLGTHGLQHFINIHFVWPEMANVIRDNPAMIYFIYNKDGSPNILCSSTQLPHDKFIFGRSMSLECLFFSLI